MLYDFLTEKREAILARCKLESVKTSSGIKTSLPLEEGWPIFYDQLIEVLKLHQTTASEADFAAATEKSSRRIGKESSRLGYPITDVVHSYGAICQAITGMAADSEFTITTQEFRHLNMSLDTAIAEAVSEFQRVQIASDSNSELKRLGFLAHELRNSLMGATLALQMIQSGDVGINSSTSNILERSLQRMKDLIDTSLTEVRLRIEPTAQLQRLRVSEIISEVQVTAAIEAHKRSLTLAVEPALHVIVNADRQLLVSALSNLVQNAIKFSAPGGTIVVRTTEKEDRILIEVEDECGGIDEEKIEELFLPFTQHDSDRTGIGLGLTISRRAVALNQGSLYARSLPGKGCIFTIDLPNK